MRSQLYCDMEMSTLFGNVSRTFLLKVEITVSSIGKQLDPKQWILNDSVSSLKQKQFHIFLRNCTVLLRNCTVLLRNPTGDISHMI